MSIREAVEVPPWREVMGRPPRVTVYPARRQPLLEVRTAGAWRDAVVMARHDWPSGRVCVQVTIRLPVPSLGRDETHCRTFAWDPDTMRVPEQE